MADGSKKLIKNVKKGDMVQSLNGISQIKCVVKFKQPNKVCEICTLPNGLKITPKHPIFYNGQWIYPKDVFTPKYESCEAVYNFIVDKNHTVVINGTSVILLGHSYTHSILKHDYLGSSKVINDLAQMPGFSFGFIEMDLS